MNKHLYVMLMENKNPLNEDVIARHVENIKRLDAMGAIHLCGPFTNHGGGMIVLNADSFDEADALSRSDPFIAEGYKTYQLRELQVANRENNYLVD